MRGSESPGRCVCTGGSAVLCHGQRMSCDYCIKVHFFSHAEWLLSSTLDFPNVFLNRVGSWLKISQFLWILWGLSCSRGLVRCILLIHKTGMDSRSGGLAPSTLAGDTELGPPDLIHKAEKLQPDAVFKLYLRSVQPAG